jgi:ribosomal protein S18 acetylase RimI-like enzyme
MVDADTLEIRRYRDSDQDAVWSLHNIALHQVGAHAGDGPWDADLHSICQVYIDAGGEFIVAELDSRVVAMGALRPSSAGRAELKRMRVHPDYQRRGFGHAVLTRLEARARELRFHTLHLDTTVGQVAAQQLYRRHGFVETGRNRVGNFELVLFEKQLDS